MDEQTKNVTRVDGESLPERALTAASNEAIRVLRWESAAARSSIRFVRAMAGQSRHTEAVSDCPHCNLLFLAGFAARALEALTSDGNQQQRSDAVDPVAPRSADGSTRVSPSSESPCPHCLSRAEAQQRLVEKWAKEADEAFEDGDICCAQTRKNDADELASLASVVRPGEEKKELKTHTR